MSKMSLSCTGGESFSFIRWDFVDFSSLVDIGTLDRFKLQISSYARMNKQLDQLTVGHKEFGDEINIPITTTAHFFWRFRAR